MKPSLPVRRRLPHDVPAWVPEAATFFITINCKERGRAQISKDPVARALLESVAFYQSSGKWWCHLFRLMPDHLHGLFIFPRQLQMRQIIASWKSYHARRNGIVWQDGFFDHRIRNDDEFQEKAAYIRNNPVRTGLVETAPDWPYQYECPRN